MKKLVLLLLSLTLALLPLTAWAANNTHAVQVNQISKLAIAITDSKGSIVAPGQPIDEIVYVINSKPEGAQITAQTADASDLERTGQMTMSFICDTAGTVEVQVLIRLANTPKYYTGIQTIQVLEPTEEKKTVILSLSSPEMIVDGDIITLEQLPVIVQNRTMIPLRGLAQAFDAQVSYDADTKKITAQLKDTTVILELDSNQYTINGQPAQLDCTPFLNGDTTMVPLRFITAAWNIQATPTYNSDGSISNIMLN